MSGFKLQESNIFQIPIAILSNSENEYDSLIEKRHVLDLEDTVLSFNKFIDLFYKNNYSYFELNEQYKGEEYLNINRNTKNNKFNFLKKKSMMSVVDIMNENYIYKNKTKIPQNKYMNLIKEVNYSYSLFDYKNYKHTLGLDDIYSIFTKNENSDLTHFRFIITANYYSNDLKDGVDINLGYLVEIPTNMLQIISEEPVISVNNEFLNEENSVENNVENMTYSNYNDEKDFLSSFNF